jgi:hypothetical protein
MFEFVLNILALFVFVHVCGFSIIVCIVKKLNDPEPTIEHGNIT